MERHAKEMLISDLAADTFDTARDTAVFWSGRTRNIGGPERAADIARAASGKTLEMVLAERSIPMPEWDNTAKTAEAWRQASARFAANASGTVRAVLGERMREDSIWATTEFPALMQNARVTRIVAIDPATLKETLLFDRSTDATRDRASPPREATERDTDRHAALAFTSESREEALRRHPRLAGAYAAMTVIEKQAHASGLSNEQQSVVVAAARQNIAKGIQQGHYPEIRIRDKNEAVNEHSYERQAR